MEVFYTSVVKQNSLTKCFSFLRPRCFPLKNFASIKDTHRGIVLSNKTPMLPKVTIMETWMVGTSNQLFRRGS